MIQFALEMALRRFEQGQGQGSGKMVKVSPAGSTTTCVLVEMGLILDRIEECKELKEVNMSVLLYKGNGVKVTMLTMTSVSAQEKGQMDHGFVKISEQFSTNQLRKQIHEIINFRWEHS